MIVDTLGGICTLTFFLTCPFGQLTKKNTCTTQSFSCPQKIIIKIIKTMQRIIISNLCKMFWLLYHKHYLVVSLLILTLSNRHDYDIFNRQINIHLDIKSLVSNDVIMVWAEMQLTVGPVGPRGRILEGPANDVLVSNLMTGKHL